MSFLDFLTLAGSVQFLRHNCEARETLGYVYFNRTFSKNWRARGPFDWPSQNMACLRTSGLRLVWATSISLGTPSSLGSWLKAKTAFFFTSVSGSFSMAPVIVLAARLPAFCA